MPPKKPSTTNAGRFDRLPAELVRRCADFSDAPAALSLHEACNKQACGVALALAFKNANELRRAARLRTETDENMFKRWESLVCPLRCVIIVMKESAVSRIFRGAAKRGIEALSELDASRVDLVNRKRDVNWRVIDKHLRKVMREMPPSLQHLSAYADDQQFLQAARSALGDAESADALFNAAIVALLFDARLQRELGTDSPAWSWISRHARIQNASEHVPAGGTAAYQLVVDFCIELGQHESDEDMHRADPPQMGDQDLALVYERERRQPLPPCARPEKYFCDGCFAKDIQPRDMARVSVACPLCSYSLCAACGEGVSSHICDGRCVRGRVPLPSLGVESVAATASTWRARRRRRGGQASRRWRRVRAVAQTPVVSPARRDESTVAVASTAAANLETTTHTGPLRSQGRADNFYAALHDGVPQLPGSYQDGRAARRERRFACALGRPAALDPDRRPRPDGRSREVKGWRPGARRVFGGDVRAEPVRVGE